MKRPYIRTLGSLLAMMLVFGAINTLAAEKSETLNFEEPIAGIDRIAVSNINGDITISGTESNIVRIEAKRVIEGDRDALEEYADVFYPKITRRNGRLMIETKYPDNNKRWNREIDNAEIDYVITLPSEFAVNIETINGDVTVSEVHGAVLTETINGEITIESQSADNREIEAESVNGEIRVAVRGLTEESNFETVNGEITVAVLKVLTAGIDAETVNGEVRMSFPEDAKFTLGAEVGMNGSIETDWGNSDDDDDAGWSLGEEFYVEVNGGGKRVHIETLNGEIEVRRVKS